jgi:hypothetical protein
MPKKSDQLAGGFDTENTGGVLTGLLAEEENFDRRAMLRLGTWGVASVGAVIIAVLANQSAIKIRRDEVAALDLTRQSMQISAIARESQNEARRLASAIDTLNTDRDRMYTRLTGVEQGLESVTGAIAKQKAAAPSPPATPAPPSVGAAPAANQPSPSPQPVAQNTPAEPAPTVGPVATTTASALAAEKARAEARKSAGPVAAVALATPAPTPSPAPSAAPSPAPMTTSAMPVMPRSMMVPPDPATPKLIVAEPPAKLAAPMPVPAASSTPTPSQAAAIAGPPPQATPAPVPAPVPAAIPGRTAAVEKIAPAAATAASAPIEVKRTEFGIDVGGANSVAGLRALWRGLLKYKSNAPLAALQPIIVIKEANNGLGMQLRLVAGPLSDAAAAARICATIGSRERSCETTVYDGQRLAIKADDAPASTDSISAKPTPERPTADKSSADRPAADRPAADRTAADKPASERAPERDPTEPAAEKPGAKPGSNKYFHHRGSYVPAKRAAAPAAPEEPPKPESSTVSSFFSNRLHPQAQP